MLLTPTPKHHISHMMLKGNDASLFALFKPFIFCSIFFGNIANKAKKKKITKKKIMCVSILLGGIIQYPDVDMMDNKMNHCYYK